MNEHEPLALLLVEKVCSDSERVPNLAQMLGSWLEGNLWGQRARVRLGLHGEVKLFTLYFDEFNQKLPVLSQSSATISTSKLVKSLIVND